MNYSRRIFDNLPIYAQIGDSQGVLQFICDQGLQSQYDDIYRALSQQEFFYDPNHPVSYDHLDWLGQLVGLGTIGKQWLGIGLNPDWAIQPKVNLIKAASNYWQIKGTEAGIRQAISLWLLWDASTNAKLAINLPFGKHPTISPPSWYSWGTRYNVDFLKIWQDKKFLPLGEYSNYLYQENFTTVTSWTKTLPKTQVLKDASTITSKRHQYYDKSRLGPRRPRMHFHLTPNDWNLIFPNIFTLNPEIWNAYVQPFVFGWLHLPIDLVSDALYLERDTQKYPLYKKVLNLVLPFKVANYFTSYNATLPYSANIIGEYYDQGSGITCQKEDNGYEPAEIPDDVLELQRSLFTKYISEYKVLHIENMYGSGVPLYGSGMGNVYPTGLGSAYPPFVEVWVIPANDDDTPMPIDGIYPPEISYCKEQDTYSCRLGFPVDTFSAIDTLESDSLYYDSDFVDLCNPIRTNKNVQPYQWADIVTPINESEYFDAYPLLKKISDVNSWSLFVETKTALYILKPSTVFWVKAPGSEEPDRAMSFSFANGYTKLYLEFLFHSGVNDDIVNITLALEDKIIDYLDVSSLVMTKDGAYGFVFDALPLSLSTGVTTPEEEAFIQQWIKQLTRQLNQLELITRTSMTTLDLTLTPGSLASLIQKISLQIDQIIAIGGDKNYKHDITIPVYEATVYHGMDKFPSVTYVDTTMFPGSRPRIGDIAYEYIDANQVKIFSDTPMLGTIYFN